MALDATDWTITRATGVITYTGDDHNGVAPTYATVIEFHRWLRDLQDDAEFTGDDELDIIDKDASERSTDNIITLKNGFTITSVAAEHLYDGSINMGTAGVDRIEYDGFVNFGNQGVMIQVQQEGAVLTDDFWNYAKGGSDDTSTGAAFLTDSGETWTTDEWVGYFIYNTTDSSFGLITANTGTTITADMQGGTGLWDSGDAYLIAKGLNSDAAGGITHRFLLKVHDFAVDGGDIDYRRLVGTCRRWGFTYSEFIIPASANGNNVFALSDAGDLNNTTAYDTVATWTTIVNETEGFVQLDVDDNGSTEDYYSEWNKATFTINQFYERMKYITADGEVTEQPYNLDGELFRGITHELDVDGGTGTWGSAASNLQAEEITWGTGATAGVGQLMAVDNETGTSTTKIWFQLLSGVVPADNETITGTTSTATAVSERTTGALVERPISTPFVGVSTGTALIGSYGLSLETTDLSNTDTVFDLTNTAVFPPNTVTFSVNGVKSGEDRVLAAEDNGGDILFTQMALNATYTGVTTTISVAAIPTHCPATGTIRIERVSGLYSRHPFSARDLGTDDFTITSHDFTSDNANTGADCFISYIDKLATGDPEQFTYVYDADRTIFVRALDGGTLGDAEGTKTTETTGVMGINGGSASISRISDV